MPETRVLLTVSDEWAVLQNGQLSTVMAANVLCRLFPVITHLDILLGKDAPILQRIPLAESSSLQTSLRQIIKNIRPLCQVTFIDQSRDSYDVVLSIGPTAIQHDFKFTVWSNGWLAGISRNSSKEFPLSGNVNPVGAYTGALLGCIEVFKLALKKKTDALFPKEAQSCFALQRIRLVKDEIEFSTLDYTVNVASTSNPQLPQIIDIGELYLVGLGAIGQAVVYTLSSFSLDGSVYLVDPDDVQWSNLNRYVCVTAADAEANASKVEIAKRLLEAGRDELKVVAFPKSYDEFRESSRTRKYDLLISAVDNNETRRLIQCDLPKVILNAGTLESMYSVSRVELGRSQCLMCPDPKGEHELHLLNTLANLTGIPINEIERLRRTHWFFEEEHIRRLLEHTKGSPTFPIPQPGMRFSDWLHEHKAELELMKCPELNIPIPLTNILAGILLAGEVVKDRYLYEYRLKSQFDHDIFCLPMGKLHRPIPPVHECPFCGCKDVLQKYHEKYPREVS
ncbi:MAG: ThiF family adenylyltransferase [Candidatus Bathyarchaeia archaeon]|nr:ThiF family adenylyltransferase [Candidatus Bathyarchaeia archaeon]